MAKVFTYNSIEKLKSRKLIAALFASGKTFSVFPLKVFYLQPPEQLDFPVKVGVGASTRNFKRAVDRNSIKRLLREAYRTEKLPLHNYLTGQNKQIAVFILYIDRSLPLGGVIKNKMPQLIDKLVQMLHEKSTANT